jgi:wobble nucleotide-excising tRNase
MVSHIQLLRNVGAFDSVAAGGALPLSKLSIIYAENGRGKTTLAAILRSLGTGDHRLITERHRIGAAHPPHVVIQFSPPQANAIFQGGAWSRLHPDIAIFDDRFVTENVYSGMRVDFEHRQNLHDLIIGAQGVQLNAALQGYIDAVEGHNRTLAELAGNLPAAIRDSLSVEDFCALQQHPSILEAIQAAEQELAAARSADDVARQPAFEAISLPRFDVEAINTVLRRALPDVEQDVTERLTAHFEGIGRGGEAWVEAGMQRVIAPQTAEAACPFCAEPLSRSQLLRHYQTYFGEAYRAMKAAASGELQNVGRAHSGDIKAAFERSMRVAGERRTFWAAFTAVPELNVDTAMVVRLWNAAQEAVLATLRRKQDVPLEPLGLDADTLGAVEEYHAVCDFVAALSESLTAVGGHIALVKERAAGADVGALKRDLANLTRLQARFEPAMVAAVAAYMAEKAAKTNTEGLRNQARAALTAYRDQVFPAYELAINRYLQRFAAGFRLGNVASVNNRGGSACSYTVVINQMSVPLVPANDGEPGFHTALSAGDRNTLALAFFFASLELDRAKAAKIVVIDDPMTSLDEHRSLNTVTEIRRLLPDVGQVIVLSHSKPFLCALWDGADRVARSALKVARDQGGSTLVTWDVAQDCITEHDRRHALVSSYIVSAVGIDERSVAAALRPVLEAFVRVGYPDHCPPETLLGPFIDKCRRAAAQGQPILSAPDFVELEELKNYGNLFHHDTNAAWQTQAINDQELADFCRRTVAFARR